MKQKQDWAAAVAMEDEAMRVGKKLKVIYPPGYTAILSNLAVCHEMVGHYEHAKQMNETMVRQWPTMHGSARAACLAI